MVLRPAAVRCGFSAPEVTFARTTHGGSTVELIFGLLQHSRCGLGSYLVAVGELEKVRRRMQPTYFIGIDAIVGLGRLIFGGSNVVLEDISNLSDRHYVIICFANRTYETSTDGPFGSHLH